MPKLLLFVPCLKAVGGDDGLLTIVSLLEYVSVGIPSDEVLEPLAATNLQWQLVSVWHREPEDDSKKFEITIDIVLPNKKAIRLYHSELKLSGRTTKVRVDGGFVFPIGLAGEHLLQIKLREIGKGAWKLAGEYPVNVNHNGTPPL